MGRREDKVLLVGDQDVDCLGEGRGELAGPLSCNPIVLVERACFITLDRDESRQRMAKVTLMLVCRKSFSYPVLHKI